MRPTDESRTKEDLDKEESFESTGNQYGNNCDVGKSTPRTKANYLPDRGKWQLLITDIEASGVQCVLID
jgi:hypothetical protein